MKGPSAMLWNYDVSDKEEAERMASLYGEDFTRAVEPGMEVETGRNRMYYHDTASSYLDDYHELADEIGRPLLKDIDELIEYGYLDESGVYENPVAVIGTMLAEAALEHARADAEYFDEDFRMRATEGIDMWTVAQEIAKTVPEAKPAEEEPTQTRGPKL